jgi:hypothetical protein
MSFSGAGFLGVYHAGAASYLQKASLLQNSDPHQILMGSSAGSLISASIRLNVPCEKTLDIASSIAKAAKSAGPLTSLTPGFSLVDELYPVLRESIVDQVERDLCVNGSTNSNSSSSNNNNHNNHNDNIDQHVSSIRNLRVYLTQTTPLRNIMNHSAHAYLDKFDSLQTLLSSLILSSYVPLGTGPLKATVGSVVHTANNHLSTYPVTRTDKATKESVVVQPRDEWYDGGLSNMWPTVDKRTLVVSPVAITSSKNICICPKPTAATTIHAGGGIRFVASTDNAWSVRNMLHPADDEEYERIFHEGYADAKRVCEEKGLS